MSSELERYFVQGSAPAAATLMAPAAPRMQHPEVCHPNRGSGVTLHWPTIASQPYPAIILARYHAGCLTATWHNSMAEAALEQHGA